MKTIIRLPKIEIVVSGGEENGRILHTYEGSQFLDTAYGIAKWLRETALKHNKSHVKFYVRVS